MQIDKPPLSTIHPTAHVVGDRCQPRERRGAKCNDAMSAESSSKPGGAGASTEEDHAAGALSELGACGGNSSAETGDASAAEGAGSGRSAPDQRMISDQVTALGVQVHALRHGVETANVEVLEALSAMRRSMESMAMSLEAQRRQLREQGMTIEGQALRIGELYAENDRLRRMVTAAVHVDRREAAAAFARSSPAFDHQAAGSGAGPREAAVGLSTPAVRRDAAASEEPSSKRSRREAATPAASLHDAVAAVSSALSQMPSPASAQGSISQEL